MNNTSSTPVDNIKRFWDSYIFLLRKQEIKPSNERWYISRAEQYIKAYPDLRLTQHQPEHVTTYLTKIGQNPRRLDWQYSQAINAIQNLFILVKSSWVNEFDWSF